MTKKRNISIKEIAKIAGVSVATVSRVINNNGRFSEETRKKVMKIIDDYDYKTNMAAKSLRVSKSRTVGLIVPNINNEWLSNLVLNIEKYFFDKNYSVFICNTSQDEEKEIAYFKSLDSQLVDGIICISGIEEIPSQVITRDIPIVCVDRKPKNHTNTYYVESNHYEGGYLATEELIKQGCKKIAIVSRNKTLSVNTQRLEGYLQALRNYNLEIKKELQILLDPADSNYEGSLNAIHKLVDSGVEFDGVFATNDWRALGVIIGLKEKGINVPEQIKVIGFDDIAISKYSYPTITTIRQDIPGLAIQASSLLMELMNQEHNDDDRKHYILPVEVIRRDSTK